MIVKYGTYTHQQGEVSVRIGREAVPGDNQVPYLIRERWDLDGEVFGDNVAGVTTSVNQLIAAYENDGKDLILFESNGTTRTSHALMNRQAIGGVRVIKRPSFPNNGRQDAEYTTWRTYSISVEALFPDPNAGKFLMAYQERISQRGTGGPKFVMQTPRNGPPIKLITAQRTPITITQSGMATGAFEYPAIPAPLYPADEHQEMRVIDRQTPKIIRGDQVLYTVNWSYVFERA